VNKRYIAKTVKIATLTLTTALLLSGVCLLGLNLYGLNRTLQISNNYVDQKWLHKNSIPLTQSQFYEAALRQENETDKEYVIKVNQAVHDRIAYFWSDDLRVPVWENWILFLKVNHKYEYYNYKKAVERGVGQCSQQAMILTQLLNKENIQTRILALDGHVVAEVLVDNNITWWILDPCYGVVVPISHKITNDNPTTVAKYYAEAGYGDTVVSQMIELYGEGGTTT
jgi:hypothetical protein